MRTTKGALPALVAASIAPGAACGGKEEVGTTSVTDGTGARGGASGTGGAGVSGGAGGLGGATTGGAGGVQASGGLGGMIGFAGLGGSGGTDPCPGIRNSAEFIVELPPEGVPADPGQICAVSVDPVESNRAARVTLTNESQTLESAAGFIEIDPALEPRIVGNPVLELIDFTHAELSGMQVEAMQRVAGGFTFQARWPAPVYLGTAAFARMTVRVSMELDCGAQGQQATRIVHAATDIHLCDGLSGAEWVSSGDRCIVCRVVAEMAPSPIVPDKNADGLPLARALRLRVVELARVANAIVLLAENDGGAGLEYEWHPSAGHVERLAPDVVVWTVAEGMDAPFIQAAVWGEDAAAVASFAWNEAA